MNIDQAAGYPNLAMFVGTTPNIGTTSIAFQTAATLAAGAPHRSVFYLCLNLKSSKISRYLGQTRAGYGLSDLRAELKAQQLTPQRLDKHAARFKQYPNLRVLSGNMQREQAELYTPEDIEHLLQTAAQAYDLCIADCSAYWDNAATIITALRSSVKLLVTVPQIDAFQDDYRGWMLNTASLFGISPQEFALILSQTGRHPDEYRSGEVQQAMKLTLAGEVPYDKQLAHEMQLGRLHEWCRGAASAARLLEPVCRLIVQQAGFEWSPVEEQKLLAKFRLRPVKRATEVRT